VASERTRAPGARAPQARTRFARAAVTDAARRLFFERGYGATTVEAISKLADVPPATVYRLFSSKLGILKSLIDVSIVGDDDDVPMADRPQVRALVSEPAPAGQLAGFVAITAQVNARVAPLYRILTSAAGTDPDAAALLDELTRQRQRGQQVVVRALVRSGALRPELREADAADLVHAFLSPEMYRLLVVDRGWATVRYEQWLTATLAEQLLGPGASPSVPPAGPAAER
jgi:AcrR family transcriptional regulator